jgi:single-strand DNA-binding protein
MELQGIVKKLGEVQTFASGFQKREMVLVTEEQYPQPISIEFLKEKGDLLNPLKEGDKVKVSINIGGREWTSPQGDVRYFNSITGWKVENMESSNEFQPTQATPATASKPAGDKSVFDDEEDDLPF